MSSPLHTVHFRVNDETGQPTPARVRFADPQGQYFPPWGRLPTFAIGENEDVGGNVCFDRDDKNYAYIDGTCEIALPAGPIQIEIHKGFEYKPRVLDLVLGSGQKAIRTTVERWTNWRARGWYAGDTRAYHLTPHAALLEAAAEDLAVVNLLCRIRWLPSFGWLGAHLYRALHKDIPYCPILTNMLAFSGQRPALERPGHLVVVNTHNVHQVLGSVALLNCHRPVFPLQVTKDEPLGEWLTADWCDQCHRKGGLAIWTDFDEPLTMKPAGGYCEPLADMILGKIDTLDLSGDEDVPALWYTLLNAGFRLPLTASSGKISNGDLLGCARTYARLQPGEELTYQNWIEAIRAGRTMITTGPLLFFQINGQGPGDTVEVPADNPRITLAVEARSNFPFEYLDVLFNGQVLARVNATHSPPAAALHTQVVLPSAGWLVARCHSRGLLRESPYVEPKAHTSPIYVQLAGQPPPSDPAAVATLTDQLEKLLRWFQQQAGRRKGPQRVERLTALVRNAQDELRKRQSG